MDNDDIEEQTAGEHLVAVPQSAYSIRVVSRMTGLSVDTLRMWERRYAFPSPIRSGAGNRLYGAADVDRLILVGKAMKIGYRTGEAIRLTQQELTQALACQPIARSNPASDHSEVVGRLLDLIRADEGDLLRAELRRVTGIVGAKRFVVEIAGPLLDAIGQIWAAGSLRVHQEHLASATLAAHLRMLSQLHVSATGPKLMLATLPREQHALGLDLAAVMAALAGAVVEMLGPDVPTAEIVQGATALRVQAVGLSISQAIAPMAVTAQVAWLAEHLPMPLGLWLGGKGAALLEDLPARVKILSHWDDLDNAIAGLAHGL